MTQTVHCYAALFAAQTAFAWAIAKGTLPLIGATKASHVPATCKKPHKPPPSASRLTKQQRWSISPKPQA